LHRQAIPRGRVAYEPNSLGGGCPFQAGGAGFVSFPQALEGDKLRGKPEKFADHYTQATLFYESQTAVEKAHIVGGFRFELSKLTVPAIRERMLASLVNVSTDMAARIADGLGMKVPEAMPRALATSMHPEVTTSPALSLTALPGDGGIRTRKVAILVADGVHGASVVAIQTALSAVGAVACIIAPRLGPVQTADSESMEATRYAGELAVQYCSMRSSCLMVATGSRCWPDMGRRWSSWPISIATARPSWRSAQSKALLDQADVAATLPSGEPDPGILLVGIAAPGDSAAAFIAAVARHRHPSREMDPPRI
jgi:catalase